MRPFISLVIIVLCITLVRPAHAQEPAPPDSARPAVAPPADTAPKPRPRARQNADLLTDDEFRDSNLSDAYSIVQRLRPRWLRFRPPLSINEPGSSELTIYVDDARWGNVRRLREIPASQVASIRFYGGSDANIRYGPGHSGGVIAVSRR